MKRLLGFDIGGTKCAVHVGDVNGVPCDYDIIFPTPVGFPATWARLQEAVEEMMARGGFTMKDVAAVGISCGGPLDSAKGLVLSPPNLPGWDAIPFTRIVTERYGIPATLMNDANACALAEWRFGAGRGSTNMLFFTMGTGFGGGMVLGGRLYEGTCYMAGEVGHVTLDPTGPEAFGKRGSWEAYCGGNGIKRYATLMAQTPEWKQAACDYVQRTGGEDYTAKALANAAKASDSFALKIFEDVGRRLGQGLGMMLDVLNPDTIVIGSIFERCEAFIRPTMEEAMRREALPQAYACCKVVAAALGDRIGAYASLAAAHPY